MPIEQRSYEQNNYGKNKKAKDFISVFSNFIKWSLVGNNAYKNNGFVARELTPIVKMESNAMVASLYSSYSFYMGRYFNKPDSKSDDAVWLNKLGKDLKRHDNKFIPKYRKLKDKIKNIYSKKSKRERIFKRCVSMSEDARKRAKQIELVRNEAKKLFQDAWKDLKSVLDKAAASAYKVKEIYKYKTETYKNLVYVCKKDIANLIASLNYDINHSDVYLYSQLGIPGYDNSQMIDHNIISTRCPESINKFASRLKNFENSITGKGQYFKELTPIIFKTNNNSEMSSSISGEFSLIFSEFINRGKGSKTSHTAKWCRSVLEDLEKHEKKYKPKYFALRKEIKAVIESKPKGEMNKDWCSFKKKIFKWRNDIVGPVKNKAIKLFAEARKSLQNVLDKAYSRAKRTLSINSVVSIDRYSIRDLADEFRKVKSDNDALWKALTRGKLN